MTNISDYNQIQALKDINEALRAENMRLQAAEIVSEERIRAVEEEFQSYIYNSANAASIERQEALAEKERLRAALQKIADMPNGWHSTDDLNEAARIARDGLAI